VKFVAKKNVDKIWMGKSNEINRGGTGTEIKSLTEK